ncbi:642_t:CDS:2, partial [Funneliformis geosporum]
AQNHGLNLPKLPADTLEFFETDSFQLLDDTQPLSSSHNSQINTENEQIRQKKLNIKKNIYRIYENNQKKLAEAKTGKTPPKNELEKLKEEVKGKINKVLTDKDNLRNINLTTLENGKYQNWEKDIEQLTSSGQLITYVEAFLKEDNVIDDNTKKAINNLPLAAAKNLAKKKCNNPEEIMTFLKKLEQEIIQQSLSQELQKFFTDFEDLVRCLALRGVSKEQLLVIKEKLIKRKELIGVINQLGQKRNELSQAGIKNREKVKKINEEISLHERELNELEAELHELTSQLPNLPAPDIPTNKEGNKVIDNTEYKHHLKHNLTHEVILKKLKLIDEEKSILLSGSKFAVYQGLGSELLHALINFMRSENSKRGYRLFDTPYLVNAHNLYNTGQFHKFQDNLYKIEKEAEENNFYLIPTAE